MKNYRNTSWALLGGAALLLGGAIACSDDETEPTGTGQLRLQLTDAPFPFSMVDSAMVTIESVSVHRADADGEAWVTVDDSTRVLNLLDLQHGTTELLADVELSVGEIDQFRLLVTEASVTLTDGRTFDLDIPSGDASGIKVFPSPNIVIASGLTTDVLLDFDVSTSFHPIPASPTRVEEITEFTFRPSLHVANLSATGSVEGAVFNTLGTEVLTDDLPLPAASVTAYLDSVEVASTSSSATGSFLMLGLAPGEYSVVATATGFAGASTNAIVVQGNRTAGLELRLDPIP